MCYEINILFKQSRRGEGEMKGILMKVTVEAKHSFYFLKERKKGFKMESKQTRLKQRYLIRQDNIMHNIHIFQVWDKNH